MHVPDYKDTLDKAYIPSGPSDLNSVELENLSFGGEVIGSMLSASTLDKEMESEVVRFISEEELVAVARGAPYELDASLLDAWISSVDEEEACGSLVDKSSFEALSVTRTKVLLAAVPTCSEELDASVNGSDCVWDKLRSLESAREADESATSIGSRVCLGSFLDVVPVIPLELEEV